jgi:hypothetical protein
MPRLKHVVSPQMVAHLWAHKAQESARNAHGNFYFDGDTIYSYGSHFPVAKHVENAKGDGAVLVTTRTYSSTTAGHISMASGACRHLRRFCVPDVNGDATENWPAYEATFTAAASSYQKARSRKPTIVQHMHEVAEAANAFAAFFGLKQHIAMPTNEAAMVAECGRIRKANERRAAAANRRWAAEAKARAAEDAKRSAKALRAWLAGTAATAWPYSGPVRLRLFDGSLETTQGAVVPKADAIRVYKILRRLRERAETYQRNSETITITLGPFELNSMDAAGTVKAGCHTVTWKEIERIAKLAGVKA